MKTLDQVEDRYVKVGLKVKKPNGKIAVVSMVGPMYDDSGYLGVVLTHENGTISLDYKYHLHNFIVCES